MDRNVQVGRTGMDSDQFKTLLAAASFMGPDEARVESNTGRVRYRIGLIDRIYPFVHTLLRIRIQLQF
jgi:hypothetical protein